MPNFPTSLINTNLVLNRRQVEQIDEQLRARWKIFCPGSSDRRAHAVFSKITPAAQARLAFHNRQRFSVGMSEEEDLAFYDELARPPFGTWVCQARRCFILDTIVAADTYLTLFKPESVLEAGTGLGFGAEILARRHPKVNFTGIDRSGASIAFACDKASGLKNVRYIHGDLLQHSFEARFDLIISLAGIPTGTTTLTSRLFERATDLLGEKGVFLGYTPSGLAEERPNGDKRLGLVYKTVIGGFEQFDDDSNAVWQSAPLEIFQLGAKDDAQYMSYNCNDHDWPVFANYVNANIEDFDRHSFSYHRTS
jgi:SAM-dependent methyltransferase